MAPLFYGARLKLERAEHHINDLHSRAKIFGKDNPHVITSENDINTGDDFIKIGPAKPLPDALLPILGDAIHNLRAALDFAWHDMVFTPHDFTRFPIRETQEAFESAVNGAKNNAPEEIINFLKDFVQAYGGGNGNAIWELDRLDVIDKHKLLFVHVEYRTVLGIRAVDDRGEHFTIPPWLIVPDRGATYRCVGHRNIKITNNGEAEIRVTLGKGMPLQGLFIIPTLRQLQDFVSGTIDALETVFLQAKR